MGIGRREPEVYHLVVYVEKCGTKLKKFKSLTAMKSFVTRFKNKHKDPARQGDNWIDYTITHISGGIKIYPESGLGPVDE